MAATLTRWLNVSAPAVTMAIRRLKRDGLIRVGKEGQITLTADGLEIANRLLNRHHLIERMLTEIFGMEWYKVHDEAEQLEHAVSADFERRLIEKLGTGEACPHGNRALMDKPDDRRRRGLRPLDEAQPNQRLRVIGQIRDQHLGPFLAGGNWSILFIHDFHKGPVHVDVHPAAGRATIAKKQAFAHGVVVEHGRAEQLGVMIAGLRHDPFCDVDDFLQLRLEGEPPRFDLPGDFMQHA